MQISVDRVLHGFVRFELQFLHYSVRGYVVGDRPTGSNFVEVSRDVQARAANGQDVEALRPTEVDYINGAVVKKGEELGVTTPVNRTMWYLVKTIEAKNALKK